MNVIDEKSGLTGGENHYILTSSLMGDEYTRLTINPGKREISQDKCLGVNFKLLMLKVLSVFLFFMTGFLE